MKYTLKGKEFEIACGMCNRQLGGREELAAYPMGQFWYCDKHCAQQKRRDFEL